MKIHWMPLLFVALLIGSSPTWAEDMKGSGEEHSSMKDMPMDAKPSAKTHHAVGTVKTLDAVKGSVTIAHGAVKTLNWPAMTMTFGVKDKALLNALSVGKKVEVDFVEQGSDYTIVKVK